MADKKEATATKKPDNRSRSWFIVCPNVDKNGAAGADVESMAKWTEQEICEWVVNEWVGSSKVRQAACIYCKSAVGMLHLHIVLCSTNKVSFSTIQKFIGSKAHIELTKGTKEQVEAYINKTGAHAEKGEVILAKAQFGELVGKQGQRSDVEQIRMAIESGLSWREVVRLDDNYYDNRYMTMIKNMYFDKRLQETAYKREVAVHWLFGGSGSGKTGITIDLVELHGEEQVYVVSDYDHPLDDYAGEPILVLNEFRGQIPYGRLLTMLEGYKVRLSARYTNIVSLWTEVYICTVMTPEQVFSKMISKSEELTDPIGQLLGRIKDISYCYKVNRATGTKHDREGELAEFYRFTVEGKQYRALKSGVMCGSKYEQMENAAKLHYSVKYQQLADTCEAFKIRPIITEKALL